MIILQIVDSHAMVRNNTERSHVPFIQFLTMVSSCKTVVYYLDIVQRSQISHFICTHSSVCMCVYLVLCNFKSRYVSTTTTKIQSSSFMARTPVLPFLPYPLPSCPSPTQPSLTPGITHLFSISIILSFQECYIHGTMRYRTFWDGLFSLSIIP